MIIFKELIQEMVDEKIGDYLPGKMNAAAQQAKQQGLHSIGFGRWANANGEYVAKTVDGRLQTVDTQFKRTQPKNRNPATMPLNRGINQGGPAKLSDPADMKDKVGLAVRQKLTTALKSSAVQSAMKQGGGLTGDQLKQLTGVPEKAFKVASYSLDPENPEATRSVSIDFNRGLDYSPKTKLYTFRDGSK